MHPTQRGSKFKLAGLITRGVRRAREGVELGGPAGKIDEEDVQGWSGNGKVGKGFSPKKLPEKQAERREQNVGSAAQVNKELSARCAVVLT